MIFFKLIYQLSDRWYNLLFNRRNCVKVYFSIKVNYNDLLSNGRNTVRSLGRNWYEIIK